MTHHTEPQSLNIRVPAHLNLLIDKKVIEHRELTGRRISRAELVTQLLERFLPELTPEDASVTAPAAAEKEADNG